MKYRDPLRQILLLRRLHWDRRETHPAVRWAFTRAVGCRTLRFGGRLYASESEERTFFNPCKNRACASCGHRASLQWRRERKAALPDVPYKGITFTMPNVLWNLFRENRNLAKALPTLAALVIRTRQQVTCGLEVGVIAIFHSFNGKLEFNSHVHAMVTAGGLKGDSWVPSVYHNQDRLKESWRRAVIALLRAALRSGTLQTCMTVEELELLLSSQENRWWSIKIQSFQSLEHFLEYAGRYLRRPPIAQRRITYIGERIVRFWYDDKKEHRRIELECSLEEFIDRWAQHILERYQHSVRNYGLFAPRSLGRTTAAIFVLLRQVPRPRPKPQRWAKLIWQSFGRDPLVDSKDQQMRLLRRIPAISAV